MFKSKIYLSLFLLLSLGFMACDRELEFDNPSVSEFVVSSTTASYFITSNPNTVYKIPVGITKVSDKDRTLNLTITSPTGAEEGVHYTIASKTITIPAGRSVDTVAIKGLYDNYPVGRKDTLVIALSGGDAKAAPFNNTFKLVMQKYCDVDLAQFTGTYNIQDYTNAGAPDGDPYTVTLSDATATTATTGTVKMSGLWGVSSPVTVELDWTDPSNFKTKVPTQPWFVHGTYGQVTIKANGTGTFSSCANTFKVAYEATVSAGTFGKFYSILSK